MKLEDRMTIMLVHKQKNGEKQILLGFKKRGMGVNKWNGFGGKVKINETVLDAAIRETEEECGIVPKNIEKIGILHFLFKHQNIYYESHVFKATDFNGIIKESEEMRPKWFYQNNLPFNEMWPDDKYWYPLLSRGQNFYGWVSFDKNDDLEKCDFVADIDLNFISKRFRTVFDKF